MPTIELKQATKRYRIEHGRLEAVRGIDLTIRQGEFVFTVGSSGAGKSTLLQLIAGQIRADEGLVLLDGVNVAPLPLFPSARIRRNFGYVAQESHLMRRRTVYENLIMDRYGLPDHAYPPGGYGGPDSSRNGADDLCRCGKFY